MVIPAPRSCLHLQRAVVDRHARAADHDRDGVAVLEGDAGAVERHAVAVVIGQCDGALVVVEFELVVSGDDHFDVLGRVARELAFAPVAPNPERVRDVPAFEVDPHAAVLLGQEAEPAVRSGVGNAWHAPAGGILTEHRRHDRLDPHRGGIDVVHDAPVLAVETGALALDEILEHAVVGAGHSDTDPEIPAAAVGVPAAPASEASAPPGAAGPIALRTRVKLIFHESSEILCRTSQTSQSPDWMLPAPSIVTTSPMRRILPIRSASACPVQREKNPDSASTAAVRWLISDRS